MTLQLFYYYDICILQHSFDYFQPKQVLIISNNREHHAENNPFVFI